jgi:hypothetical protein
MRFFLSLFTTVAAIAFGALPAHAQARSRSGAGQGGGQIPQIRVENRLSLLELDGKFGGNLGGGPSPAIDLAGDTDLNDDGIWGYDLHISLGDARSGWLDFGFFRFASKGERFLHNDIQFRGVLFPQGSRIESRLDLRWSELVLGQVYGYGGGYYIGYEVGAVNYRFRLRVKAPLDGLHARVDEEPGLPLVGIKLAIGLGSSMLFTGTVRGNFFSFGDLESTFLAATIDLRMQTGSWLLFHAGWRYFRLDATFDLTGSDEAYTDFYVQGPYFSIEIRLG